MYIFVSLCYSLVNDVTCTQTQGSNNNTTTLFNNSVLSFKLYMRIIHMLGDYYNENLHCISMTISIPGKM